MEYSDAHIYADTCKWTPNDIDYINFCLFNRLGLNLIKSVILTEMPLTTFEVP
jgi:hypothetical protein